MYYNTIILIPTLVLLLFASCKNNIKNHEEAEEAIEYNLGDGKNGSIEDVFAKVELIPLLFEGNSYPSAIREVRVCDKYIFVFDNKQILHVFTTEGKYVASSTDKRGQGPGEYSIITGFSWNPYSQTIEILTPQNIIFYDINFRYKKDIKVPTDIKKGLVFGSIEDLSATEHVLLPTSISRDPQRVFIFDSASGKIIKESSYEKDVISPLTMQTRCLYELGNGFEFVAPAMTGCIYGISDQGLGMPIAKLEYGADAITKEELIQHDKNEEELSNFLMSSDKGVSMAQFLMKNIIITLMKQGKSMRESHYNVFDTKSRKSVNVRFMKGNIQLFPFVRDVDSDNVYTIMDKATILESPQLLLNKLDEAETELSKISDEDYVLMKYTPKELR